MMEYATKITALYSRLSVGDEDRDGGESNSIVNQKAFLERYARQRAFCQVPFLIYWRFYFEKINKKKQQTFVIYCF